MLEIHLLDESGNPVPWKEVEKSMDPVEGIRIFETDGMVLTQKSLVQDNEILMDISLACKGESGTLTASNFPELVFFLHRESPTTGTVSAFLT